jgi:hypothetical protein
LPLIPRRGRPRPRARRRCFGTYATLHGRTSLPAPGGGAGPTNSPLSSRESRRSWCRPHITDDGLGRQTHRWAERLTRENPDGVIVLVDTLHPDDHTYLQDLYNSYRDVSAHATRVHPRVLLILLNKFDLWGRTTASREAMTQRYRTEVFTEIIHQFRSRFGVTVQFGYASLTQPGHAPYNNLTVKEFLTALDQRPPT